MTHYFTPKNGYVSANDLAAYLGVSNMTVYRWSRPECGRLPRPHKLGENCTRWYWPEVHTALGTPKSDGEASA